MITLDQAYPRFRDDLVVSRREGGSETVFIINDPRSQRFFRFGELEVFLARQLDGETPLDVVRQRAEEHFSAPLSEETLAKFLESLNRMGLLEGPEGAEGQDVPRRRRIRGNLLYLRWKLWDPDRFLESLHGRLRFLFTPAFVAFSAALILLAIGVVIADFNMLGRGLPRMFQGDGLVLAWIVLLAVITLHEFAHGLTCKHFGGHVHELGFMLIFFQPAFYCNVSDAWMFPEKSKRLWVTAAGAYFEMFVWALATLTWRVTDPATIVNFLALVVMLTSAIKSVFNLNPLIKLDGYYLLSDFLDIPNLNWRAFAYVRDGIKRSLGLAVPQAQPEPTPRERRIYVIYGLLATGFSFWLLGWIILGFGNYMTSHYQATGFMVVASLVALRFRVALTRMVLSPVRWLLAPKGAARAIRLLKTGVTAAVVSALLFFGHMELTISAPLTILPVRYAEVRTQVEGIVDNVFVDEGQNVKAGDLIARLSDRGIRADLEKTNADIDAAQANLTMLEAGPRTEEVDLARREVDTSSMKLQQARREYETSQRMQVERIARAEASIEKVQAQLEAAHQERQRMETLVAEHAGSGRDLQEAIAFESVREKELAEARADLRLLRADDLAELREARDVAEKELQTAQAKLDLLLAGTRQETVESARANVERLQAQRQFLQQQIQSLDIVTPIPGVITTAKPKDKVGQLVQKGDLIASVHELSTVHAEIAVPEKEIADVKMGQNVVLKARAYPGRTFTGKVASIASAATTDDQTISGKKLLVTAALDNPEFLLKPEMTGHAKIQCGQRRIVDIVTRRFVRYIRVEFWSWW